MKISPINNRAKPDCRVKTEFSRGFSYKVPDSCLGCELVYGILYSSSSSYCYFCCYCCISIDNKKYITLAMFLTGNRQNGYS